MTKLDLTKDYGAGFVSGEGLHQLLQQKGVSEMTLTIAGRRSDSNKDPWILSFVEIDDELRLKKQNARALVVELGKDDSTWPGRQVALSVDWKTWTPRDESDPGEGWTIRLRVLPTNAYAASKDGQPAQGSVAQLAGPASAKNDFISDEIPF